MNQPKFTVLILATLVLSLFAFACKDYITAPENIDKFKNNDSSFKGILPINLEEFNIIKKNGTKSSSANTAKFLLDSSMLNWSDILQENRINGIVFTQVPFKMNDSTVSAAISNDIESLKDYKVNIKSFYIVAEDCFNNVKIDYIVTMIPTKEFYDENKNYDFININNYSGIILYSDTTGNIFRAKSVKQGIFSKIYLSSSISTSNSKYIGFFNNQPTLTKSDPVFDGGELNTIVIYADNNDGYGEKVKIGVYIESVSQDNPQKVVGYKESTMIGGGRSDSSYLFNNCTLNVYTVGCLQELLRTFVVPYGKSVTVNAKNHSDTCIFMQWLYDGDILSNNKSINLTLYENTSITASYIGKSNEVCFELAKLASDSLLKANINLLLDSTKRDSLEHGYKLQSDGTKIYGKGTKGNLSYRHNPGQTYIERFHTHPPDSTQFCGGADIWSIFWMLHKNQIRDEDIPIFKYGMIAYNTGGFHEVHILKITNKNRLLQFFSNYDKKRFTEEFEEHVFRQSIDYNDILLIYTNLLNDMGLSLTRGTFSADYTYNSSGFIRWNKIGIKTDSNPPELYTNVCSNL